MKYFSILLLLAGILAFTACNKGGNAGSAVVTKAGDAVASADEHAGHSHAEGEEHHEGETAEEHAGHSHAEGEHHEGETAEEHASHSDAEEHKDVKLPESVTLASGESVPVVGVVKLDEDPTAHKGQVAVIGLVETVYADRRTFTLCDATAEVGCKDGCCPASKFPASVPTEQYEGELPATNEQVTVIGELTPGKTGYSFKIQEVRKGDEVIIKQKPESSPS